VQLFALGPVFSAFGSSVSDICHVYERGLAHIAISDENASSLQTILEEIKAEGTKDLLGEGIKPESLTYEIEIEASGSAGNSIVIPCSESILTNPKELKTAFAAVLGNAPSTGAKDISLELMRVRVKKPMSKPHVAERALKSEDSAHARIGARKILWGSSSGDAQVYRWESLEPGNRVVGPAILEGINTTYFVPEGWTIFVDRFGNGALTKR
jgi:N-methylhydantoinase A/oxoprolinase/acetone carboxylase beta subunit